jgi:integrase
MWRSHGIEVILHRNLCIFYIGGSLKLALSYRKRGEIWYCRGTVRVGREVIVVPEFSTGSSKKADAISVGAAEESKLRNNYLDGGHSSKTTTVTIKSCIKAYMERPGGLHPYDVRRLNHFLEQFGKYEVSDARRAWAEWISERGTNLAPSTVARWRSTILAALTHGAEDFGVVVPNLRPVRNAQVDRIAYLTPGQESNLLAAYSDRAFPIMLLLCETGLRTQEALRLDWRHIDWSRGSIIVEHSGHKNGTQTKSGRSRSVFLRPNIRSTIESLWHEQGHPDTGTIFLSKLGKPYSDTRSVGGNPLASAHRTACRKVGITGFRIHDWRHHFAVWFLKRGGNLRTLCQIAGWASMRMVQRYAVFEQSDLDDAMLRTSSYRESGQNRISTVGES